MMDSSRSYLLCHLSSQFEIVPVVLMGVTVCLRHFPDIAFLPDIESSVRY